MTRRTFLSLSSATLASVALDPGAFAKPAESIDAAWYRRSRRFASLPMGRVAYVEHGHGPAALFLHGFPLNGFQWRGALEKLHTRRRCIAPDLMSMGYSEIPESQPINPHTQVNMLASLLDSLEVKDVDLVANDSGGLVAQLFVAEHPHRVRTLLLTNCDVDQNSPPPKFLPAVALAKKGLFAERYIAPQLQDKQLARSDKGIGEAYTYPDRLSDETIGIYFQPLVQSAVRKSQVDQYTESMGTNLLSAVSGRLQQWNRPARMVWALKDQFFGVEWAEWLNRTLPGSRGVRSLENANLFFPEEMPEVIAEEAGRLWE
ncbi:MAG: Hydrolase [Candidatus Angelobacter sp.]|nr:Hydrolase [Candidatus Angelobacter sp.]